MQVFTASNPNYEEQVKIGFARQNVMNAIGAYLMKIAPGQVEIALNFRGDLTQQHEYLHAGIVTIIADSACGFAAFSLMPENSEILTVEYKVNFMSPARGEKFIATGRVIKPGRTLTVCAGEVAAIDGEVSKTIAVIQTTMMRLVEGDERQIGRARHDADDFESRLIRAEVELSPGSAAKRQERKISREEQLCFI